MDPLSFILEGLKRQCLSLAQCCSTVLPWLVLALVFGMAFAAVIARVRKHARRG
jgi:hypothetical protein